MQAKAWFALTVIRSKSIHTSVLAAPIVNLALINICRREGKRKKKIREMGMTLSEGRIIYSLLSDSRFKE